jgi:hypothetical protein
MREGETYDTPRSTAGAELALSPGGLVLLAFLAVAAFFLITEHRAHVLGALPYVLFLLCPILHLLMHGRHGSGHAGHGPSQDRQQQGGA